MNLMNTKYMILSKTQYITIVCLKSLTKYVKIFEYLVRSNCFGFKTDSQLIKI